MGKGEHLYLDPGSIRGSRDKEGHPQNFSKMTMLLETNVIFFDSTPQRIALNSTFQKFSQTQEKV